MHINEETEYKRKKKRIQDLDEFSINYLTKIRYIQKVIDGIERNKKIAIYGGGEHTEYLFKCIDFSNLNIDFLIDKKNLHEINGLLVKKPNKENLKGLDVIVISSFSHQEDIKQELMQQNLDCELLYIAKKSHFLFIDNKY